MLLPAVLLALLLPLSVALPHSATLQAADGGQTASLPVVTVMPASQGQVTTVVDVRPGPLAPLPPDAVTVSAGSARPDAQLAPVMAADTPVGIVVDASRAGRDELPGMVSGAAGLLLQLSPRTPVTLVADRDPPRALTPSTTTPSDAIRALGDVRAQGARATPAAVDLALRQLPAGPAGARLVVLCTTAPAPSGAAATGLQDALASAHAVLAVVAPSAGAGSWSPLATRTGGVAVEAGSGPGLNGFDQVHDTLRSRYAVTFRPPPGAARATVRIDTGAQVLEAEVPLPAADGASRDATSGPGAAAGGARDPGTPGYLAPVLVAAALALVAVLVVLQQRRRPLPAAGPTPSAGSGPEGVTAPPRPPPQDVVEGPVLPGVHLFDLSDPSAPREIAVPADREAAEDTGTGSAPGDPAARTEADGEADGDTDADTHRRAGGQDPGQVTSDAPRQAG